MIDIDRINRFLLGQMVRPDRGNCIHLIRFILRALEQAEGYNHIMDFTPMRALATLFSLINRTVRNIVEYNDAHSDFPLPADQVEAYHQDRQTEKDRRLLDKSRYFDEP